MKTQEFNQLPINQQIVGIIRNGTFISDWFEYRRYEVRLYHLHNAFWEVFFCLKTDSLLKIELVDEEYVLYWHIDFDDIERGLNL